ncbi:MAG: hypothetical protein JW810_10775, partial [Sedimentisphaerales bacterium]|nr:hypothetical protein [Sedimentisphaerales bacterium]
PADLAAGQQRARLPRPAGWVNGPGGIQPDKRPWRQVSQEYAFVEELARLRPGIQGAGNLQRFDYWLETFRYLQAVGKVNCTWARYNAAVEQVRLSQDPAERARQARSTVLPIRRQLVADVAQVHRHLLASISTSGGMGTIANWQQHILPVLLDEPGAELAGLLSEPLPDDALGHQSYEGPARLIVPTVRTSLRAGEDLRLKVIILSDSGLKSSFLYWRALGRGEFIPVPLVHVARGVHAVTVPADVIGGVDFEYYIEVRMDPAGELYFPATAPRINQTVVVMDTGK